MIISVRDVAVTGGILFQVFLMVLLGREEVPDLFQFYGKGFSRLILLCIVDRADLLQLLTVRIIDSGAILYTPIIPLPVHRDRIYDHEIKPEQFRQGYSLFVVDNLPVSACPLLRQTSSYIGE